jgi:hypothetical protein
LNKIYKKSIIGDIKFNENFFSGEDLDFNLRIFFKSKKIVFLAERLYNYNISNQNSLTRSEGSQIKSIQSINTIIKNLYQEIGNTLEEKDNLKENILNDLALLMFCHSCQDFFDMFAAARKINELYCDKIIDLNMEYGFKAYAAVIIALGKAVEFIERLKDAF